MINSSKSYHIPLRRLHYEFFTDGSKDTNGAEAAFLGTQQKVSLKSESTAL